MSFINKELYENADSQRKATQITWEIADCLHQVGAPTYNAFPLIPYLLHKVSLYNNPFGITLQAIVDGEIEVNAKVSFMKGGIAKCLNMNSIMMKLNTAEKSIIRP